MRRLLYECELQIDPRSIPVVNCWLARGDGIAVYENQELGNPDLGHRKFVSFGSPAAQLETANPPERLPDIGNTINWRYRLVGCYIGNPLKEQV